MQNWNNAQNWFIQTFRESSEVERDTPSNLRILRNITITIYIATILMMVFTIVQGLYIQAAILAVLWLLLNVSGALLLRGRTFPARFFSPLAILITIAVIAMRANGLHDSSIVILPVVIIFASLTLGARGALIFSVLTSVTTIIMGILEISGAVVNRFSDLTDLTDIVLIGVLGPALVAIIQIALLSRLNQSIQLAQKSASQQKEINAELLNLQQNLESTISERTQELEKQSGQLEQQVKTTQRRAQQFQTVADVARVVANIRDLDTLFKTVTELISQQLGYYHIGIFLNDEANNYALLAAANSAGGQKMLARSHRLKIGETGIVGNVARSGAPRVAINAGEDAVFFNNPDLPETRSEMAVALKLANQIVGVLDIQSTETNAFSQEDVEVFSALADQVAIAIENVRLLENTQKSLAESETIYRQYLRSEWGRLSSEAGLTGFRYKITGASPLEARIVSPEFDQAISSGNMSTHKDEKDETSLVVPIKLRGEILGIVNVKQPGGKVWSKDEIELIQSVVDRVAVSAENARLFEETTRRAERERAVSSITTKIRSTNDPNEMLSIAISEIKNALNAKEIRISEQTQKEPSQGSSRLDAAGTTEAV
ncbi:MAG: GAF domain-containing protein [Anaerolineales bacterium]|jgi:GAF domain-containing protein|nr:GAF domain-containing protein [Anaerolineales bacterium]